MRPGTKTLLFGDHCMLLHPLFVAAGWWKVFGFPWDPRLWLCFFLHDLGYFRKPDMNGQAGGTHPEFGARLAGRLFGKEWHDFCLYHSRQYAKRDGHGVSALALADKTAFTLLPWWLFILMSWLSGSLDEYCSNFGREDNDWKSWVRNEQARVKGWVASRAADRPEDGYYRA